MSFIIQSSKTSNQSALMKTTWDKESSGYLVGKDQRYRLGNFVKWLDETGGNWYQPDLAAYRDKLLQEGLSPVTVQAHLSTIRGRYTELIQSNITRNEIYRHAQSSAGVADRKAFVDEIITQLENATKPHSSKVQLIKKQGISDSEQGIRLNRKQANALLRAPGLTTLRGLRDSALIALMLSTGIQESEASQIDVEDLKQHLNGAFALKIRSGKGVKQRLIPYGDLDGCLIFIDAWLKAAGILSGPIFRGFYKGEKNVRTTAITPRAIQMILAEYAIFINEKLQTVTPHDLRRTYARRLYEAGVDILVIQQNLGHSNHKTTEGYIGGLDKIIRKPPVVYDFDSTGLSDVLSLV